MLKFLLACLVFIPVSVAFASRPTSAGCPVLEGAFTCDYGSLHGNKPLTVRVTLRTVSDREGATMYIQSFDSNRGLTRVLQVNDGMVQANFKAGQDTLTSASCRDGRVISTFPSPNGAVEENMWLNSQRDLQIQAGDEAPISCSRVY